MLQFGLRLGQNPRQVMTTTPRPVPVLKRLIAELTTAVTRAHNRVEENLADGFFRTVIARYEGTRLGRQELDAELIEDNPDALWSRETVERGRVAKAPADLVRVVVGVDPPAAGGPRSDECGIVCAALGEDGQAYVLDDRSMGRLSPLAWAKRVAGCYRAHEADRIVAEANQGGDMVGTVMRQELPEAPIRLVRATRGKRVRAEPIAALYERGLVHHVGPSRSSRTRCATGCPARRAPTGWMPWCGR